MQSEERFRLVLANVQDHAIITLHLDGTVSSWNVGAQNVFGYSAEEMLGKAVDVLFTPEDREAGRPAEERKLAAVRSCADDTRWHMRKGGVRFFSSGSMEGLRDEEGKLLGYVKVVRDITEQRQNEIEREQLLESERAARLEAERSGRMKDEFLATLSHELRTPLNAILGWTQLLRRMGPHGKDFALGIDTIERNTKLQAQLIADLLDMSSIMRGKVRLELKKLDPIEVLEAAVGTVEPTAKAAGVNLLTKFEPRLGVIEADSRRLQQVFWNLLTNAIKFTPEGGTVEISARRIVETIEVSVSDTGRGIKPDFIPTIFERFRQEDASTTRKFGGLGIGLSLVKSLTEMHGGSVAVESAGEGKGARFTVTLPLVTEGAAAGNNDLREEEARAEAGGSVHPPTLAGLTILVVDDDEDSREIIRRTLLENDASVVAVGSAAEAMKAIGSDAFDLMVSDIGMPEVDGYQLIRHIRQLPAHLGGSIPSVALTAFSREQDRAKALSSGYQAHLSKPVDAGELISVLLSIYDQDKAALAQNG